MSITLDPDLFLSEGDYIDSLADNFHDSTPEDIIAFAHRVIDERRRWQLPTAIAALVWTNKEQKRPDWLELRDKAWNLAKLQFSLAKCQKLFIGLDRKPLPA